MPHNMTTGLGSRQVKVAFVGAGKMAREHLRAFKDISGVVPVGITSRTPQRAVVLASEFGIGGVYRTVDDLVDATAPDIVVVSIPPTVAVEQAAACLGRVAVLLIEKPVGVDLTSCRALFKMTADSPTQIFVGLNRRSYAATRAAIHSLADEDTPRVIEVRDQEDTIAAREAGHAEIVVRNWMYANAIHTVDYFRIFGRGELSAVDIVQPFEFDKPSTVVANLRFASGDTGIYVAMWNRAGPWACTVTTNARRIEMRPLEIARTQLTRSREVIEIEQTPWDMRFKPGIRQQAQEVVEFVCEGVAPRNVPDIGEALRTTELVSVLYGS
jgi:predicted dehydrogenase